MTPSAADAPTLPAASSREAAVSTVAVAICPNTDAAASDAPAETPTAAPAAMNAVLTAVADGGDGGSDRRHQSTRNARAALSRSTTRSPSGPGTKTCGPETTASAGPSPVSTTARSPAAARDGWISAKSDAASAT